MITNSLHRHNCQRSQRRGQRHSKCGKYSNTRNRIRFCQRSTNEALDSSNASSDGSTEIIVIEALIDDGLSRHRVPNVQTITAEALILVFDNMSVDDGAVCTLWTDIFFVDVEDEMDCIWEFGSRVA